METRCVPPGNEAGFRNLFSKTVDDASDEERLTTEGKRQSGAGFAFSTTGKWLAFTKPVSRPVLISGCFACGRKSQARSHFWSRLPMVGILIFSDGRWLELRRSNEFSPDGEYTSSRSLVRARNT